MICPQCQKDVPVQAAQYGALYTCPNCSAVYFVNFEGEPDYGDTTLPAEFSSHLSSDFSSESEAPSENNFQEFQSLPDASSETSPETFESFQSLEGSSLEPSDADLEQNPFATFEQPLTSLDEAPTTNAFSKIAEDIQSFGNQDESVSHINYDLKIAGLDSKEIVSLFEEAIEDSKFGWMAKDILSQVKDGECTLKNLNPVQAFILGKRIQFLDLEIEWKQNVETV